MKALKSKKTVVIIFSLVLCLSNSILAFAESKSTNISAISTQCFITVTPESVDTSAYGPYVTEAKFIITANCTVLAPSGTTSTISIELSKNVTEGSQYVRSTIFSKSELNTYLSPGWKILSIDSVSNAKFEIPVKGQINTATIDYVSAK